MDLVHTTAGAGGLGIKVEQSRRQMRTSIEILRRFEEQPGQILADEVGMGKTYAALSVAASVVLENPRSGPVVIMVPPALREKWPLDWQVFSERYIEGRKPRAASADRGVEFLKLLDDPPGKRARIIFLKNGAFGLQLRDPWVKLAVIKQALHRRSSMKRERRAVDKWGARVVRRGDLDRYREGLVGQLLSRPYAQWKQIAERHGLELDDDPVPDALVKTIDQLDLEAVREGLRQLPSNRSAFADRKIAAAATSVDKSIRALWRNWLGRIHFRAPLLILDEAHHAKNPGAQLSRLFLNEEEGGGDSTGALHGRFDRMLFLTATPFQLGHHELIQVLSRFKGVNWATVPGDCASFEREIAVLGQKLSATQRAMAKLDQAWGKLRLADVEGLPNDWFAGRQGHGIAERPARARRAFTDALKARSQAQSDLKRWVIRHRKPDKYSRTGTPRRSYLRGAQITDADAHDERGLDIDRETLLPFLLAGRAQVAFRAAQTDGEVPRKARALFADGICSSYEAYLDTRRGLAVDEESYQSDGRDDDRVIRWYLRAIQNALPADDATARAAHPKIGPVVERVTDLWLRGEKVVIFCHFRASGSALRRHISRSIENELWNYVAREFGVKESEAEDYIRRLSRRFERSGGKTSPVHVAARGEIETMACRMHGLDEAQRNQLTDVLLRYLRSPTVLARYGLPVQIDGASGVSAMLDQTGLGGSTLRVRLQGFVGYVDGLVPDQRDQLLDALSRMQTSSTYADVSDLADEGASESERILATVRLANGEVKHETRRRLMLAFNSPLLPEVLVASQVLAEGVDLHQDCRHVIHHDLDWNPSTLEQRTGRVDRLGSKGERLDKPIEVALPYIAKTQDEKMYRVVRDRERWFQVVMGARHEMDETEIDEVSERVELPIRAADQLGFRLEIA